MASLPIPLHPPLPPPRPPDPLPQIPPPVPPRWIPLSLLSLSHLLFYVAVAQTLRCINGFKYQRRCHKLTLGLATERLKRLKMVVGEVEGEEGGGGGLVEELEICYQEPPESYLGKFKRSWGLYFGFLILTFGFMVSATVVLLCF
ncbi:hypothetical protein QJS10_CPB13g01408 [Acorus calamus]|uniref:Uncharacterized protein n=1 Tax=Acorus calamus TaxID=4465 RepID=A0AAV9DJG5_ACOCL|nr:hypothetical protein QJS10_CPB13g01408 [Acorus calamus]